MKYKVRLLQAAGQVATGRAATRTYWVENCKFLINDRTFLHKIFGCNLTHILLPKCANSVIL